MGEGAGGRQFQQQATGQAAIPLQQSGRKRQARRRGAGKVRPGMIAGRRVRVETGPNAGNRPGDPFRAEEDRSVFHLEFFIPTQNSLNR
jgi:hypothetical protein